MERKDRPVDVICVCNADGGIRPLRLRLEDEDRQMVRIDIDEILHVDQNLCFGTETIVFLCGALVGNRRRIFEMKYSVRTHTWCILRHFS